MKKNYFSPIKIVLVLLIVLFSIASCSQTGTSSVEEMRTGAKNLAEQYWSFVGDLEFSSAFELLLSKDKDLINKETFIFRTMQQNEFRTFEKVGEVKLSDDQAVAEIIFSQDDDVGGGSQTEDFKLVFKDDDWHPLLNQRELLFYGADPEDIGIQIGSVGNEFMFDDLSAIVTFVSRRVSPDIEDANELLVEVTIENLKQEVLEFDTLKYVALVDATNLIRLPSKVSENRVEIPPRGTITIETVFDGADESGLSILVGSDDDHFMVPL